MEADSSLADDPSKLKYKEFRAGIRYQSGVELKAQKISRKLSPLTGISLNFFRSPVTAFARSIRRQIQSKYPKGLRPDDAVFLVADSS